MHLLNCFGLAARSPNFEALSSFRVLSIHKLQQYLAAEKMKLYYIMILQSQAEKYFYLIRPCFYCQATSKNPCAQSVALSFFPIFPSRSFSFPLHQHSYEYTP